MYFIAFNSDLSLTEVMVKVQTFDRHQVWRFNKTRKLMSIQFGELAMQGLLKMLSEIVLVVTLVWQFKKDFSELPRYNSPLNVPLLRYVFFL